MSKSRRANADPDIVSTLGEHPQVELSSGKKVRGRIVEPIGEEEWLPIDGWEDRYHISTWGRVKALGRKYVRSTGSPYTRKERILKATSNNTGMLYVKLTVGWNKKRTKRESHFVHRLVAKHFLPNSEGKPEVNHKDGNRFNNCVSNLEWVTHQENMDHAVKNLLLQYGERHWKAKLKEDQVKEIRRRYKAGEKRKVLADEFGVRESAIKAVVDRKTWRWLSDD